MAGALCSGIPAARSFTAIWTWQPGVILVSKGMGADADSYSAFQGIDESGKPLAELLRGSGVTGIFVGGLATDYCVKQTALDGINHGFVVVVLGDAIRGVDLNPDDSEQALTGNASRRRGNDCFDRRTFIYAAGRLSATRSRCPVAETLILVFNDEIQLAVEEQIGGESLNTARNWRRRKWRHARPARRSWACFEANTTCMRKAKIITLRPPILRPTALFANGLASLSRRRLAF